jgi:hypothetical protein
MSAAWCAPARLPSGSTTRPLAIVDKRRERPGESEVMNIIGDVQDRFCILIDDIVDSAGTLCNAAGALREAGAEDVVAYCTHGVLSGGAVSRVENSALTELVITNSIYGEGIAASDKVRILTIAPAAGGGDQAHRRRKQRFEPVRLRGSLAPQGGRFAPIEGAARLPTPSPSLQGGGVMVALGCGSLIGAASFRLRKIRTARPIGLPWLFSTSRHARKRRRKCPS